MSTRELIDKELASLPEDLQRKVYDFAMRLKQHARDESFYTQAISFFADRFTSVFHFVVFNLLNSDDRRYPQNGRQTQQVDWCRSMSRPEVRDYQIKR